MSTTGATDDHSSPIPEDDHGTAEEGQRDGYEQSGQSLSLSLSLLRTLSHVSDQGENMCHRERACIISITASLSGHETLINWSRCRLPSRIVT